MNSSARKPRRRKELSVTAVASLFITLSMSLLITRVASLALMLTGMSRESARFQARSAFTGVGFTTDEARDVVEHPVRRRIIMLLMLLGNAGIATVVAASMLTFMETTRSTQWWQYVLTIAAGLLILWFIASNQFIEKHLNRAIAWVLSRWGRLDLRDYVAILQLQNGYAVSELLIEPQDWLADKSLIELRLPQEGVLVLGIRREGGAWLGTPTGDMEIHGGDTVVIYGPIDRIEELDQRRHGEHGDTAHQAAVEVQRELLDEQEEIADRIEEEREEEIASGPSA